MITAVLAANKNLELIQQWYSDFRARFPKVLLTVSCIQPESQKLADYIKHITGDYTRVFVARPKDDHEVSFSENYNAAFNLVETDKFVLIHDDMQFCDNFFEILDQELDKLGQGNFITYTTFEPPVYTQHRRTGKIIMEWSNWEMFNSVAKAMQRGPDLIRQGSGFFSAGWTQDFYKIGGFDQNSFKVFCEDDDFVLRQELKGFKSYVSNWACSYHFVSRTSNNLSVQREQLGQQSCSIFYEKWGIQSYQVYPTGRGKELLSHRPVSSEDFVENNLKFNYLDLQKQIDYVEL